MARIHNDRADLEFLVTQATAARDNGAAGSWLMMELH